MGIVMSVIVDFISYVLYGPWSYSYTIIEEASVTVMNICYTNLSGRQYS